MILVFELSMPHNNSWNNKWSGEGNYYAETRHIGNSKQATEQGAKLDNTSYRYDFGDGWTASISVRGITASEATKIRGKSSGFCGYSWMIDSILLHGKIKAQE